MLKILALVAVAIASYTDLKTLEVPDWLNYSLIATGIAAGVMYSLFFSNVIYIVNSLIGLAVSLIIGMAMYYTGQWGGGDSKMIFGLGAILGLSFPFKLEFYSKFLINMLFAGAAYGLVWILVLAVKDGKKLKRPLEKALKQKKNLRIMTGISISIMLVILYFSPVLLELKIMFSLLLIMMFGMMYLIILVRTVEKVSMIKMIEPEKLTEGDWIVDEIKINGKYITGPKELGITKKQIAQVLKLKKQSKIQKIKVKYGIPFVPSFLIAMVYTLITNTTIIFYLHF